MGFFVELRYPFGHAPVERLVPLHGSHLRDVVTGRSQGISNPSPSRTHHWRLQEPSALGMYDERHEKAKSLMKREPVYLEVPQRERAYLEFAASLLRRNIPVVIGSVDRIHFHWLARFPDHDARKWIGIAKRESSYYLQGHRTRAGRRSLGGADEVQARQERTTLRSHARLHPRPRKTRRLRVGGRRRPAPLGHEPQRPAR